jgi:hypothetical protein
MKRIVLVPGLVLGLLAGCGGKPAPSAAPQTDAQAHILRTYKVPDGQDKRVERLLRGLSYPVQVVTAQGTQTQFVRLGPELIGDGYMTLSAPAGIHEGVRELLDQLKGSKVPPPPATVETTFWLVLGWPAQERSLAPDLKDAAAAIDTLGDLGPMRFELLDRVQVMTIDGEDAQASGNAIDRLTVTPVVDGDSIALRLNVRVRGGQAPTGIETSINVKPDQYAILGQAGYVPDRAAAPPPGRASLFYVVRARTMK